MVGIKGWEMPERCGDCYFCDWVMGYGGEWGYYCIVSNGIGYKRINYIGGYKDIEKLNKPSFCPLIEIKEKEKMKEFKLTLVMSDNFEQGNCKDCPLGSYVPSTGNTVCAMNYRSCDCPLREGQAIEEDYTD